MAGVSPAVGLLVLDFAGVCTPTSTELLDGDATAAIPIRPGIVELVASARDLGVTTAILSNEISISWKLAEDLFSMVDHVVSCADNRIFKPDRRAFQRCLYVTGHAAEETLVVDDEADNITVAASLGMHTILFDTVAPGDSIDAIGETLQP